MKGSVTTDSSELVVPAQPPRKNEKFSLSTSVYRILRIDSHWFCFIHLSSLPALIPGARRKGNMDDKDLDQKLGPMVKGWG